MWYIYINKNEITLLAGKWIELEDIMLSEVSQVQKDKNHVFSHMWKIDPKHKCIHKTYIEHVFL
jgi:hypothetical protein